MMTPADLFVEGASGNRLHLADWGGEGTGLLLLHGMGAHTGWWDAAAPLLAPGRRVLALDMRGHGESAWLEPPRYSIEDYAADIDAVRRAMGWERFALAAHSLGARVALRYASQAPERLEAAAFLDFLAEARPGSHERYQRRAK
ncbi:MAG: alpha/beta fold hydrolase, partial [Elusimicrobia bacterium]|nr:alpha/beta fold hydrolase [Elusimicrobiota bacterium]